MSLNASNQQVVALRSYPKNSCCQLSSCCEHMRGGLGHDNLPAWTVTHEAGLIIKMHWLEDDRAKVKTTILSCLCVRYVTDKARLGQKH